MKLHGGPDGPEASTWMRAATMTYFMGSSMLVQFTTKVGFSLWRRRMWGGGGGRGWM